MVISAFPYALPKPISSYRKKLEVGRGEMRERVARREWGEERGKERGEREARRVRRRSEKARNTPVPRVEGRVHSLCFPQAVEENKESSVTSNYP